MATEAETDLLHGYAAIGRFLGMTPRQVQAKAEKGRLPVFKMGRNVCARRSSLNTWLADLEAKAKGARHGEA